MAGCRYLRHPGEPCIHPVQRVGVLRAIPQIRSEKTLLGSRPPNAKPASYRTFPWAQGAWNMTCLVCFGHRREGLSCRRPSGSEAQPGAPRQFLVTPASSIPRARHRFAPKELPRKKRLVEKLPVGFGSQLHVEVVHVGTVVVGRQHVGEHARLRHFTHDGPEFFSSG